MSYAYLWLNKWKLEVVNFRTEPQNSFTGKLLQFGYIELKISIKKQGTSFPCSHSEHTGWSFLDGFSPLVRARPKITTFNLKNNLQKMCGFVKNSDNVGKDNLPLHKYLR